MSDTSLAALWAQHGLSEPTPPSDTPETDAFFFRVDIEWDDEVEFARKLECERDEAREECRRAEYDATQETIKNGILKSQWIAVTQERDQWRECAERLAEAVYDLRSGWRYVQHSYGQLYGVGWERAEGKADTSLSEFERLQEASK